MAIIEAFLYLVLRMYSTPEYVLWISFFYP